MKFLLILFLLTLSVPFQTHILSLLPFPFPFDLVLIVTYYFGYFHGKNKGMTVGAYLGILTDVLSGEHLGVQMFLKALVGYFSAVFGMGILSKNVVIHFVLLLFFSLMNGLLNHFLIYLFVGEIPFKDALLGMILPSAAWNALFGSLMVFFLQKRALKKQSDFSSEKI
ncbi:MAG: rod shape-determining protein MreD [bacterium]